MSAPRQTETGFTVVELIVALGVFGILSVASLSLMTFSIDAQTTSREALAEMSAIRRMNASLTNDLVQIAPRPSRNEAGQRQAAFFGGDGADGELLLSFVRRGWTNYDSDPRSSLQKIDYRLVEGRLERIAYPYVDGAAPLPAAVLIENIESVALRYRIAGEWRDRWDPSRTDPVPEAVEAVITIGGLGPVRQLFQTGVGA